MSIYAIGDLHLSLAKDKPMSIFGENWKEHEQKIKKNWIEKVKEKPALESVCKYLCIEYTFYWLNIWNCTLWLFRWL